MSTNRKTIMVSEDTWKALATKGTLEDSFDTVIRRLLAKEDEQV